MSITTTTTLTCDALACGFSTKVPTPSRHMNQQLPKDWAECEVLVYDRDRQHYLLCPSHARKIRAMFEEEVPS